MPTYTTFLRGINVGNIRIKMADLKEAFEVMGMRSVQTILQSGNVVFEHDDPPEALKATLEAGLSERFRYAAFVQVYPADILPDIIAAYPFPRDEAYHAYVIFVETPAAFEELRTFAASIGNEAAQIQFGKQVIYWQVLKGNSTDTPLAKILAKVKYKSTTTVRNIQTIEKMLG